MGDFLSSPDLAASIRGIQQQIDALKRAQSGVAAGMLYAEDLSTVTTTSTTPVDLGGPSITLDVSTTGHFLDIFIEAEMASSVSNGTGTGVYVSVPGDSNSPLIRANVPVDAGGVSTFLRYRSGTTIAGAGVMYSTPAPVGSITVAMLYTQGTVGGTGSFRNRKMFLRLR